MSYALRMEGETLKIEFSGTFTNQDLSHGALDVAELEESSALIPHRIADLRPVERLEIDFIGVLALADARRSRRFENPFKTAIIAPDQARFGFARMFQTLNDHPQMVIAIFGEEAEAVNWLRLPDLKAPENPWQPDWNTPETSSG
ncbi:MAG TPA: hypothetical protein VFP10_12835 [Candidatus Eisenbacteria bacterium]|nr:hypothetical protein [Candidatus Eisenbacteria bacterium]